MLWNIINFNIEIPQKFKTNCFGVFKNYKNNKKNYPCIHLSFTDSIKKNNLLIKPLKTGILACDTDNLKFYYNQKIPFHTKALLNLLLLQIIKIIGFKFDLILLHSACVVKNGKACLIPGAQGRGKTTFSRLVCCDKILNDDLSLAAYDHSMDKIVACKVPSPEDMDKQNPFLWEGPFPVEKIFFLRRELKPGIKKITKKQAFNHFEEEGNTYNKLIKLMIDKTDLYTISYELGKNENIISNCI